MNDILFLPYPLQALLATLLTWLMTALGAAVVIFTQRVRRTFLDAMLGFGAGVMLASSFWSLLEPGIALAETLHQPGFLAAGLGFLCGGGIMLLGDALMARMNLSRLTESRRRAGLLIASITLHNIPEGLAVGVAFGALSMRLTDAALTGAWMLAIGIALQNFPEGATVSLPLRREGMSRGNAFFYGQLSGVVEPIAAVIGALLAVAIRTILPFLLSLAAGAMIAVVVSELIPESQRSSRRSAMTMATLLGFTVMMVLDVALS
ncbi:MAG: ZIP family metal transporter [Aristaeellaceae bacterium]